jgi:hypothetical protein
MNSSRAFPVFAGGDSFLEGLSTRQYYAAAALQGIASKNPHWNPEQIAELAFAIADAMVEAEDKR